MAKYMTNSFLALKVIYCNEMYDLCQSLRLNYDIIRKMWVADPRIGSSHTFVYDDNRGFGGSCFPKDISSLQMQGEQIGSDMTLITAVIEKNNIIRENKK